MKIKTAEEILQTITCNGMREITEERALQAMKEYADQFRQPDVIKSVCGQAIMTYCVDYMNIGYCDRCGKEMKQTVYNVRCLLQGGEK